MEKDFESWNKLKKDLHHRVSNAIAHPREIWWCSFGVNIGAELDGKNERFERPAIVIKVYNRETMLVLPLTSKKKNDMFHIKIIIKNKASWVKLTQLRVISNKRLQRKVGVLKEDKYKEIVFSLRTFM